mgnify:CR=1 FL=1
MPGFGTPFFVLCIMKLKNDTIINLDNDEATEFYEAVNDLKLNQKKLSEALGGVVEGAVNKVGVDLNTASASLHT